MTTPSGRARAVFVALSLLLLYTPVASASPLQAGVRVSPAVIDHFPLISISLAITDASGARVSSLPLASYQVIEDQKPVELASVEDVLVGSRQVYLLNTTSGLKVRDAGGTSRYDQAREALYLWWKLPQAGVSGIDDLTLLTAEGPLVTHRSSAAELASALDQFQPSFSSSSTGLDLLLSALESLAADKQHAGMDTYLVFVTALIELPQDLPVTTAITRAQAAGASIFPVLLAPASALELPQAAALDALAKGTGGQLLLLDPAQGLAPLADRILGQRSQVRLTYRSQASTAGQHTIAVHVTAQGLDVISDTRPFEIDLRPPDVAFVQPPDAIQRQSTDSSLTLDQLPPTSAALKLLVTFPDGHPRAIRRAELLVDGKLAAERSSPPFDQLTWDLAAVQRTATYRLQATVEDSQGLKATTEETSVRVQVIAPRGGLGALRPALAPLLAALGVLVLGVVTAAILVNIGRRGVSTTAGSTPAVQPRRPVRRRAGMGRLPEPEVVEGFLAPVDPHLEAVRLMGVDLLLGRDAALCTVHIDDPSVDGMHARLIRQVGGTYLLRDQGSVAGTWVNGEEVGADGRRLRHGDLIHLGRVGFRFRLANEPPPRPVRVSPSPQPKARPKSAKEPHA
jgi:hypothetical protein